MDHWEERCVQRGAEGSGGKAGCKDWKLHLFNYTGRTFAHQIYDGYRQPRLSDLQRDP
jgi:hypothetical protein